MTIHKEIPYGKWFVDEVAQTNNFTSSQQIKNSEQTDLQKDYLCDPDDYEVFINPTVIGGSPHHSVDWEYCLSFPNTRCSIKRPVSIKVTYIDEFGNIVE